MQNGNQTIISSISFGPRINMTHDAGRSRGILAMSHFLEISVTHFAKTF